MFRKRLNVMKKSLKSHITMGLMNSKDFMSRRKIDEATSNASLSNMRYVITEKPKWKVFKKKEIVPIPAYPRAAKGCPCGSSGPCKQRVTPNGVTLHYPHKKRKFNSYFATIKRTPAKTNKGYFNNNSRTINQVKIVRPKKFTTWRLDSIKFNSPYLSPSKSVK